MSSQILFDWYSSCLNYNWLFIPIHSEIYMSFVFKVDELSLPITSKMKLSLLSNWPSKEVFANFDWSFHRPPGLSIQDISSLHSSGQGWAGPIDTRCRTALRWSYAKSWLAPTWTHSGSTKNVARGAEGVSLKNVPWIKFEFLFEKLLAEIFTCETRFLTVKNFYVSFSVSLFQRIFVFGLVCFSFFSLCFSVCLSVFTSWNAVHLLLLPFFLDLNGWTKVVTV